MGRSVPEKSTTSNAAYLPGPPGGCRRGVVDAGFSQQIRHDQPQPSTEQNQQRTTEKPSWVRRQLPRNRIAVACRLSLRLISREAESEGKRAGSSASPAPFQERARSQRKEEHRARHMGPSTREETFRSPMSGTAKRRSEDEGVMGTASLEVVCAAAGAPGPTQYECVYTRGGW